MKQKTIFTLFLLLFYSCYPDESGQGLEEFDLVEKSVAPIVIDSQEICGLNSKDFQKIDYNLLNTKELKNKPTLEALFRTLEDSKENHHPKLKKIQNNGKFGLSIEVEKAVDTLEVEAIIFGLGDTSDSRKFLFRSARSGDTLLPLIDINPFLEDNLEQVCLHLSYQIEGFLTSGKDTCFSLQTSSNLDLELSTMPVLRFTKEFPERSAFVYDSIYRELKQDIFEVCGGAAFLNDTIPVIPLNNGFIYIPSVNSIYFHPDLDRGIREELIVHEIGHALNWTTIITMGEGLVYDEYLETWEEGFTQAMMREVFNHHYRRKDKKDRKVSYVEPYYDEINDRSLSCHSMRSSSSASNIHLMRYETSATVFSKLAYEYSLNNEGSFYRDFRKEKLRYLNDYDRNYLLRPDLIVILSKLLQEVEGEPLESWISKQQVLRNEILPEEKIYLERYYNFYSRETVQYNRVYFQDLCKVDSCYDYGNSWSCCNLLSYDNNGMDFILSSDFIGRKELKISHEKNPPEILRMGYGSVNFSSSSDTSNSSLKSLANFNQEQDILTTNFYYSNEPSSEELLFSFEEEGQVYSKSIRGFYGQNFADKILIYLGSEFEGQIELKTESGLIDTAFLVDNQDFVAVPSPYFWEPDRILIKFGEEFAVKNIVGGNDHFFDLSLSEKLTISEPQINQDSLQTDSLFYFNKGYKEGSKDCLDGVKKHIESQLEGLQSF